MQPGVSSPPALAGRPRDAVGGASADPWDAPYFGAPTYFAYRAGSVREASADVPPVNSGTLAITGPALETHYPPYFGAPVHLTYEPSIPTFAHSAAPESAATTAPAAQSLAPASTGGAAQRAGRQGGWLSWLLGKRG